MERGNAGSSRILADLAGAIPTLPQRKDFRDQGARLSVPPAHEHAPAVRRQLTSLLRTMAIPIDRASEWVENPPRNRMGPHQLSRTDFPLTNTALTASFIPRLQE